MKKEPYDLGIQKLSVLTFRVLHSLCSCELNWKEHFCPRARSYYNCRCCPSCHEKCGRFRRTRGCF